VRSLSTLSFYRARARAIAARRPTRTLVNAAPEGNPAEPAFPLRAPASVPLGAVPLPAVDVDVWSVPFAVRVWSVPFAKPFAVRVQFLEGTMGTMVAVTRPPDSSIVQLHMHSSHWVGEDPPPTETEPELVSAKAL